MISKCLTYLSLMVLMLAACAYANSLSNFDSSSSLPSSNSIDESSSNNKPKYILKCFANKHDCSILETIPDYSVPDTEVVYDFVLVNIFNCIYNIIYSFFNLDG